ncbi:MAG TPA: hypothetical protein VLG76_03500 [Rhabdochlamydiaceae bacterium]|nr:hypothetical protein [Rhabdochlamydiaceae bacterium]
MFRSPDDGFIEGDYLEEEGVCSICQRGDDAAVAIIASGFFHRNGHQYHGQCIRQWLEQDSSDPADRHSIAYIQARNGEVEPIEERRQGHIVIEVNEEVPQQQDIPARIEGFLRRRNPVVTLLLSIPAMVLAPFYAIYLCCFASVHEGNNQQPIG